MINENWEKVSIKAMKRPSGPTAVKRKTCNAFLIPGKALILFAIIFMSNLTIALAGEVYVGLADPFDITGRVLDARGQAVAGVNVSIRNTKRGTTTDENGNFTLRVESDNDVVVFSHVRFITQEIRIGAKRSFTITLNESSSGLDSVVVVGYGTVKKRDLTGSVASLGAKDIAKSGAKDFMSAMQGRMAGVFVKSSSGEPGAAIDLQVRGANSINAASTPLYVIDGVQIDMNVNEVAMPDGNTNRSQLNPLSSINPSDIQSIEVLKDASATAIFGSRGANGVVLITTKNGKGMAPTLEYTGLFSWANAAKKLDLLSPDDYVKYQKYVGNPGFLGIDTDNNGTYETPRDFSKVPSHDWQDEMLRTGFTQDHTLSASGGMNKTNYSASLSYLDQNAILINNKFNRYNFRVNLNHQQNSKLSMGFNALGSYSINSGVATNGGGSGGNGALQYILISNPWEIQDPQDATLINDKYVSPLALLQKGEKSTSLFRFIGSSYLDYLIMKNLKLRVDFNANVSNSKIKEFYGSETPYGNPVNGYANIREVNTYSFNQTSQLNYNKNFGSNHRLDAMAAWEINRYNYEDFYNSLNNFIDQSTGIDNIAKAATYRTISTNRYTTNRLSFISRANYAFKEKILLTASFRADGSDRFGANERWAYFPSGAIAYRISQEDFLRNSSVISDLKIRASYGKTGNDRITPFSFAAQVAPAYYAANNVQQFGMAPSTLANPDLKWESTDQFDAGVDLALLKSRINITVDYYLKKTKNLLLNAQVAGQSGFATQWKNIGGVDNQGLEFTLNTVNIKNKNFSWQTNFNISFNKNNVTDLGGAQFQTIRASGTLSGDIGRLTVGEQIGALYGYVWDGIYQLTDFTWQNGSDPSIPPQQRTYTIKPGVVKIGFETAQPGKHKFKDLNGDGVVDANNDRSIIGYSAPKHWGGMTNSFQYKNFDGYVSLAWSYGNKIYNDGYLRLTGFGGYYNVLKEFYDNYWTPDRPSNTFGSPLGGYSTSRFATSYYVQDGSYLRIQDVSIGYSIPSRLIRKAGISNARVFVSGSNLYTFTNYPGFDPEVGFTDPLLRGVDIINYPRPRTFTFGVTLKL